MAAAGLASSCLAVAVGGVAAGRWPAPSAAFRTPRRLAPRPPAPPRLPSRRRSQPPSTSSCGGPRSRPLWASTSSSCDSGETVYAFSRRRAAGHRLQHQAVHHRGGARRPRAGLPLRDPAPAARHGRGRRAARRPRRRRRRRPAHLGPRLRRRLLRRLPPLGGGAARARRRAGWRATSTSRTASSRPRRPSRLAARPAHQLVRGAGRRRSRSTTTASWCGSGRARSGGPPRSSWCRPCRSCAIENTARTTPPARGQLVHIDRTEDGVIEVGGGSGTAPGRSRPG